MRTCGAVWPPRSKTSSPLIATHRDGPPLVLVTHGSVVSDLTGVNIRMGAFVVLRRGADGSHTVAGDLYIP